MVEVVDVEVDGTNKIIILIFLVVLILVPIALATFQESYQQKRSRILNELSFAIEQAKAQGKYDCCIEPPCTMCYLGGWIWENGICRCDEMILNGELDKVCPQCKKQIEEGNCKSTNKNICGAFNTTLEVLK